MFDIGLGYYDLMARTVGGEKIVTLFSTLYVLKTFGAFGTVYDSEKSEGRIYA